ncbi:PAS domain S-box protein [Desulfovibrio sulfodismutans]|uniref:histidine kinase n=1 Tax=Desulfolutivibrio sulfodismutans TaxID=63561 RepID=A0A7K3NJ18_9BACT|nr:ATP-binding protein [Desulfolutivibrio sulfodismutans]NDY56087.1 PAS domain S-box protein [Desulfolutivibrio sulfodismutans]QLA12342.1 PAS domain S-box protein [Desulfolutivibrio sulfodismutans DSM 3696]
MNTFRQLAILLQENESWLMNTVLNYAIQHGYSKYTSTLVEAWRLSISGLTNAISQYISENPEVIPDIRVDSNYRDDAVASFGVVEAKRHRSRGIDLGMFLGLFKYYRDSYLDLVNEKVKQNEQASQFSKYLIRCFDRIELSFCIEWATASEDIKLEELQTKNMLLVNEKNKYLTLFESFLSPLILLRDNHIENINMAGIQLLEPVEETGMYYYDEECRRKLRHKKSKSVVKFKNKNIMKLFPWMKCAFSAFDKYDATCSQFVTSILNETSRNMEDYCITIFPMRDLSKKFLGKIIFFENISEKKMTEMQLRESESKYRTLVETMNEGILVLNGDLVVTYINEKVSSLLGYPKSEIIGHSILKFLHAESKDDFIEQQRLRKEGNADSHEFVMVKSNGEKVFVLSSPTPLFDASQKFEGSYEVLTNISNIKLIEMQLIHSQKMETIGVMASGIAHEINTPLQYVIGNSSFIKENMGDLLDLTTKIRESLKMVAHENLHDTLQGLRQAFEVLDIEFLTEEMPRAISECMEGLGRIAAIVTSVKRFSHPDSDVFKSINVNKEIENTITISRNEWKSIAKLTVDFEENLPNLQCIPSDFNQVILNLIINAAHALQEKYGDTSETGSIHMKTYSGKHHLFVSVTDNGAGIQKSIRDKIFSPFFTTKDVGKGTGMGLAIVLKIIEKHKGKIWFESVEGEGTTFFVQFPLKPAFSEMMQMNLEEYGEQ